MLTQANFMLVPAPYVDGGSLLRRLDLSDGQFSASKVLISAKHTKLGGDGLGDVGFLDATGIDLGKVVVKGDIGDVEAGAGGGFALTSLSARTLGAYGLATQSDTGDLDWHLNGEVGAFKVSFDVKDSSVNILGSGGSIKIGGSLLGGLGDHSGSITATGKLGPVKIGRDIVGGSGSQSGFLSTGGALTTVILGGSLRGGAGVSTGEIFSTGAMGTVKIGRDVLGGSGSTSGIIFSANTLAGVKIGGSLVGGQNFQTGEIISFGNMGKVKIARDLIGGSISGTQTSLFDSGYIAANRIAGVFIGGSIVAGVDDSTAGALFKNASIRVNDDIGAITVKGSLVGRTNDRGDSKVIIQARGQNTLPADATSDIAIGRLSIGGEVQNALILAGFDSNLNPANADASVGAVKVGRNWTASSLVAGARDSGGDGFGINDALQTTSDEVAFIARIASIKIKGVVNGTATPSDHFGFVAQQIGSFKSVGFTALLHAGPPGTVDIIELSPRTTDVTIREV
jgi:hypothetical protein